MLFRLEDVRVHLGDTLALQVSKLTFSTGSLIGLIGPNGSGKTTLLRVLAGLVQTQGVVEKTDGVTVAYVGQHQHQHQWMPLTVHEVIRMGRYRQRGLLGRFTAEDNAAVHAAADRLEVGDLLSRRFGALSGGQRQRVLIASAVAADASCLLLDEPITGLDLTSQQIILDVANEERSAGRLVVLSTHHLDEARHCDRVLVLRTQVIADDIPSEALQVDNLAQAFGQRVLNLGDGSTGGQNAIVLDDHGH